MKYPFNSILNICTAQDSNVEPIVQGNFRSFNFRMMLYNMKYTKISTMCNATCMPRCNAIWASLLTTSISKPIVLGNGHKYSSYSSPVCTEMQRSITILVLSNETQTV